MTAEELFAMRRPKSGRRELSEGAMIVLPPGGVRRGKVGAAIGLSLGRYVRDRDLGSTMTSRASFILRRNPDTVRAATVAFIRSGRDFYEGPPDLAVEIFDWNNRYPAEIARRVRDWMDAGTRMLIVIEPEPRTARIFTQAGEKRFSIDDALDGADVVPGWTLPLRELFAAQRE